MIPLPARHYMKMQMVRMAGSGNFTKVEADIEASRFIMLP